MEGQGGYTEPPACRKSPGIGGPSEGRHKTKGFLLALLLSAFILLSFGLLCWSISVAGTTFSVKISTHVLRYRSEDLRIHKMRS
ncbi:hypothetical protein M5689_020436 [Euphorbia peplus]|nr:hypothetical protein M5689_020436 [Euphorbia peplus]